MSATSHSDHHAAEAESERDHVPTFRPVERLWPYADLSERHSVEELAELDPDLRAALWGERPGPFSVTVVFPSFDGERYAKALNLARAAADYRTVGAGESLRHRARFPSRAAATLRELYELVYHLDGCEVLVDDRPMPYARELWLPLLWLVAMRGEPIPDP
jgi:hypothetical protein